MSARALFSDGSHVASLHEVCAWLHGCFVNPPLKAGGALLKGA